MNPKLKKAFNNPSLIPGAIKNQIAHIYKSRITKDKFAVAVDRWFKDKGDETLRLAYPLSRESIVFDLGGYKGDFAAAINERYGCYVYIYEPVLEYYQECTKRFKGNDRIKCFNYGLSDENGNFQISNEGDGSSIIKNNNTNNCKTISIKSFASEFQSLGINQIDLLKINIEGPEFLVLPHIISEGIISKINHLQVQFHSFYPNAIPLRESIRTSLSETHYEAWNYHFVWESWTRTGIAQDHEPNKMMGS